MRGNDDNIVKIVMSWRPTEKRPRGRPRKKWMNEVEEDLKRVGMNDWIYIIPNRESGVKL